MSKKQAGVTTTFFGKDIEMYALTIIGPRRISQTFDSLVELKAAVSEYLTPGEIREGVLERLTTFSMSRLNKYHYVENKWRNLSVCAYPKGDGGPFQP